MSETTDDLLKIINECLKYMLKEKPNKGVYFTYILNKLNSFYNFKSSFIYTLKNDEHLQSVRSGHKNTEQYAKTYMECIAYHVNNVEKDDKICDKKYKYCENITTEDIHLQIKEDVYPPNSVKHLIDKMNNSTSAGVECDKKCKNNSPDLSAHIPPHFNINEIYVEFTEKMDECKHKLISTKCCVYSLLDVDDNEVIGIIGINTFHDLDEKTIPCLCDIVPFLRNMLVHTNMVEDINLNKINFIANMSHEVRTPLNAIMAMIEMLGETTLVPKQIEYIDTLQTCSIQLMDIVNDILDFSKIYNKCIHLKMEPFSLNKCLTNVYLMMNAKAKEKNLLFEMNTNIEVGNNMVVGDSIRMKQILINVISNAIKFTKTGQIKFDINVIEKNNEDNTCRISFVISDTGIGISQQNISKIFNAFKQIENDYLNENGGTGLGLSITKYLVDLYKGTIDVKSKEHKGTTFTIEIPFAKFNDVIDDKELIKFFMNKNVLIYNTDLNERLSLISMMNDFGIRTILTVSLEETITYLTSNAFHFEFMLLNNTDLDYQTIMKIQKVKNDAVKVIILDTDSENTVSSMCDYNLMRPINKDKISYLLNIIYTSNQYNTLRIHNEIFLPIHSSSQDLDMNTNAVTSSGKKIKYETQRISLMNVSTMKSPNFLNENKNENNKIKILVAEDNVSNQIVICELLKKIGYENITVAHDGVDAYTQMISIHFDIIFMDLKMPMMNGLDVTIKYNSHLKDTNAKSSIIIAVTANLSDNIKTRCFEAGMHGFIAKPINKHDLKNIMDLIKQNE